MAFLSATSCGGDEVLRRHIAGQVVELAEKYAPDTAWYIRVMAQVSGQLFCLKWQCPCYCQVPVLVGMFFGWWWGGEVAGKHELI